MTGFEEGADKITFSVSSDGQQLYDLTIRYAGIYGEKYTNIVLNNGVSDQVHLPPTESFEEVSAGQVLLNDGDNTIDVVSHWGW